MNPDLIRLFPQGIWYYDLPELLKLYDIGLILYKGFNENFTYNETNKLFEYHVCGLDVWFSYETLGIHKYIRQNTFPKIIQVDYNHLDIFDWRVAIRRDGINRSQIDVNCDQVYEAFLQQIIN